MNRLLQEPIVFMGSGPVASKSLELLANDFSIEAVITKPKPAHHKGSFPVIDVSKNLDIKILTASNKQELTELMRTKPVSARVAVLIDFGIIVAQEVIDYFPKGIVNSHFSVLPEWRGADPITFAVLSGQNSTGVSLMLLVNKMDEGPLISFGEYELPANITTPQLTDHLINLSYTMLKKDLPRYMVNPNFKPANQSVTKRNTSYSHKLTKDDGIIDWNKSADQLEREVRAFRGWPGSKCSVNNLDVVITAAHTGLVSDIKKKPGDFVVNYTTNELAFITSSGALFIDRLTPAGKKDMSIADFLNGYKRVLKA